MAERAGAQTTTVASSHVPHISQPRATTQSSWKLLTRSTNDQDQDNFSRLVALHHQPGLVRPRTHSSVLARGPGPQRPSHLPIVDSLAPVQPDPISLSASLRTLTEANSMSYPPPHSDAVSVPVMSCRAVPAAGPPSPSPQQHQRDDHADTDQRQGVPAMRSVLSGTTCCGPVTWCSCDHWPMPACIHATGDAFSRCCMLLHAPGACTHILKVRKAVFPQVDGGKSLSWRGQ